ncbi:DUF4189 domain-containing protein [Xanthomonas arboricola]|uniref:DUF4189 domain-containing protein n=1 Tax=Xanthomonas arboricola TaxID=56448 RepID=UPI000CEEB238|nr:DUF4189 domain-containing protein [Xanthomonas arboricola]PPU19330.1 hypothetical protein XarbCFBP7610_11745 [Xanthomonas arboricola]
MKLKWLALLFLACVASDACAEGGCPPGQYPIGGQGAVACAPIPQSEAPQPKAIGKWIKTWGAIATGSIDSIINYGVSTGQISKSDAQKEAMSQCSSHGEKNCEIVLTYTNQCAAVASPQINGKPSGGTTFYIGRATSQEANSYALSTCTKKNKAAECKIIYENCTQQLFQKF